MTEHPDHLLAELADGELDETSRAAVEAHLAACERCREELGLAREGRAALRELGDLEPPSGIPLAVQREARGGRRWWRAAGVAAAAAAVIAAGAFAVSVVSGRDLAPRQQSGAPQEGGGDAGRPEPAPDAEGTPAAGAGALVAPRAPVFEETGRRYDRASLPALGRRFRERALAAIDAGFPRTAATFFDGFDLGALAPQARRAFRCVLAEVPPSQLVAPLAVEGATFEGTPAYVAAFLQGPAPDRPYDRVLIWVVDRESCSLLSLASQRLTQE